MSRTEDPAGDPSTDVTNLTLEDTSSSFELSSITENATPVTARVPDNRPTPSPRLTTTSLPPELRVLKLRTLADKLRLLFPEDAPRLSSILPNDQIDEGGFVDPRGPKPQPEDTLIHVFVDYSNILIGFVYYLKQHSEITAGCQTKHLFHAALALILERGRSVTRRVLVTSSPLYQPMDSATQLGYEVRVLARVPDMGDGMDKKSKRDSAGPSIMRKASARNLRERRNSAASITTLENSDSLNAGLPPIPLARTESGGTTGTGSRPSSPGGSPKIRYREQGVDEVLQLKLYQAIADGDAPPNATIVLATGDGRAGQFNEEGFIGCVRIALKKGWRVELYSWEDGLSRSWKREFGEGPYKHLFSIHGLSDFGQDLLEE